MANITAAMVQELRQITGAGMVECKKALTECEGDVEKAKDLLRKKGLATANKKAGRIAAEGQVHAYIHGGGRVGVLLEVNIETDFAARTDDFKELVHEIALHICASSPTYVTREEVPQAVIDRENEIYADQLRNENKPEKAWPKIMEGKLNKFFSENCLLDQPYAFENKITIKDMVNNVTAKIGEKISVRRFVRWELGEGLEKRVYDLAKEVAAEMK
jgi:elongation factor Ts